jgi:hypothetical protein
VTQDEVGKLTQLFAMYAAYYRVRLDDQVLRMYAEDLSDLELSDVRQALDFYRKNPKNRVMPLPANVRGEIAPEIDPDSAAREIASRITLAISQRGSWQSNEARQDVGEIGWEVVRRFGGWQYVCEQVGVTLDPGTFTAQTRDLAKSLFIHDPHAMAQAIGAAPRKLELAGQVNEMVRGLIKTIDDSAKGGT